MSSLERWGLRFGLSRHCSVVRTTPRPFISMDPPSMTIWTEDLTGR